MSNTESDKNKGNIWWSVHHLTELSTPLLVFTRAGSGSTQGFSETVIHAGISQRAETQQRFGLYALPLP